MPLPGPSPWPMPVPPLPPPSPGLLPPEGDMARDPVLPVVGSPTFEPGWLDITAPELEPLPPFVDGAKAAPGFNGAPSPRPLRPRPEPVGLDPPLTDGGGGTTLFASCVPPGAPGP